MRFPLICAAFLISTGAGLAQAPAAPDAKPMAPVTGDRAPHATTGGVGQPLETGANSFTESQVKERFVKMGFGEVKDLHKDESGIWRGKAEHAGRPLTISMDYKGNVAAQ